MKDLELLELAAKAAGIDLQWMGEPVELKDGFLTAWNPLKDDGDALRLAVSLELFDLDKLLVDLDASTGRTSTTDNYAATRLAIVLAAAEIGKAMP